MLPANLGSLSNEELLRFLDSSADPTIRELCYRLGGINWERQIHELEEDVETAQEDSQKFEDECDQKDIEIEELKGEIEELKDLLEENNIIIPEKV